MTPEQQLQGKPSRSPDETKPPPDRPSPAEDRVDLASELSFPASDPPFWTLGEPDRTTPAKQMPAKRDRPG